MTVKELIEELRTMPQDAQVILQKDSEGNGYSPLAVVDGDAVYIADTTYSGDVYDCNWTAEEALMPEPAWAAMLAQPRCVVLAPVN